MEPFAYEYMSRAIWMSTLVGGLCAFLSSYLMLKGWSLMGDALSHAVVPGVAGAYILGLPFSLGAFLSGSLAAFTMLFLNKKTKLKEDAIIGIIFTSFFALGLFIVSLNPTSVDVQKIILGNILAITDFDTLQLVLVSLISFIVLILKWKEFMIVFFDEVHAKSVGIDSYKIKILFFTLLSVATVSALQTVGAFLVIALVVTPGATAYLITNRFSTLIILSISIGSVTSFCGSYLSYFIDGATGGVIVLLLTIVFFVAFIFNNNGNPMFWEKDKRGLLKDV
jgi:manganese/iron transport system permease protein